MNDDITIAKTISIREAGYDEFWLQDRICKNPSILNLGDLETVEKERRQPSGGILDILLKDPDEETMYEVEVMLGNTDEKHIIRAIEYWNIESRRIRHWRHCAVLVAERINRRFFDVIYRFTDAIPLIGIQATIVEVAGNKALHFTTILDTYQEPDDLTDKTTSQTPDEGYWTEKASWVLEAAKTLIAILKPVFPSAEYILKRDRIRIHLDEDYYMTFAERSGNKARLAFWFADKVPPQAIEQLDKAKLPYKLSKWDDGDKEQGLYIIADSKSITNHSEVMLKLTGLTKLSWED
jgi:hypothetical protein